MSTLIKQLLENASHTTTDYSMGIDSSIVVIDQEKFARLLIKECVAVCLRVAKRSLAVENAVRAAAVIEAAEEILNRFDTH